MLTTFTLINVGFSLVVAGLLLVVYLFFLNNVDKSRQAIISSILLLGGLSCIQFEHFQFIRELTAG